MLKKSARKNSLILKIISSSDEASSLDEEAEKNFSASLREISNVWFRLDRVMYYKAIQQMKKNLSKPELGKK
jgi:hypothetical protein